MIRPAICLLLAVQLVACSSARPRPSIWQRYDALRTELQSVTALAAQLALAQDTVVSPMRHGNVRQVKRTTARLKGRAGRLSRRAGRVGNQIRALLRRTQPGVGRRYLSLVLLALENQWAEGRRVEAMADVMWADPLLMSPRALSRLRREQRAARRYARRAVTATRAAAALRRLHPEKFRYIPVPAAAGGDGRGVS